MARPAGNRPWAMLSLPNQGYFAVPRNGPSEPPHSHLLCGRTALRGAISPNSGRPLLQLLALNTSDERLDPPRSRLTALPLLYSWTCPISEGVFSYRVTTDHVDLIVFDSGDPYEDFPYEDYPVAFPGQPVELVPLTGVEQDAILRLNTTDVPFAERERFADLDKPRHQVGGVPRLLQPPMDEMKCPSCGARMPFLASIANENGTLRGFADNDFVQVIYHLCRACVVLSCYHMVD